MEQNMGPATYLSIYMMTFKMLSLFELNPVQTIVVTGMCIIVSLGISSQKTACTADTVTLTSS